MANYKPRNPNRGPSYIVVALFILLLITWLYLYLHQPSQHAPLAPTAITTISSATPAASQNNAETCATAAAALGLTAEFAREGLRNLSRFQSNLLGTVSRRFELPTTAGRKGFTAEDWAKFAPIASCPPDRPVTQYGGFGDGSKKLCKLRDQLVARDSCIIYSLGSNGNFQFEDAMLAATPCEVHTFDCTYDGASKGPRHHYHKWCVGPPSAANEAQAEFRPWANITQTLGHKNVDLLKCDIEGWENTVLAELKPDGALPDELAVEFHIGVSGKDDFVPHTAPALAAVFQHLSNLGYATHTQEVNSGFAFYGCEFSFIRFPSACRC